MTVGLTIGGRSRMRWVPRAVTALGLLGYMLLPAPAHAEIEVVASTVAAYRAGAKLPDGTRFNVPAGGSVSLLVLPSRAKVTIPGGGSGDSTVLDSNVAGIAKHSVWPANAQFSLPAGGMVQLMQNDTRKTVEIRGEQDKAARKPFGGTRGVTAKE